jgi:hypothetical protein
LTVADIATPILTKSEQHQEIMTQEEGTIRFCLPRPGLGQAQRGESYVVL